MALKHKKTTTRSAIRASIWAAPVETAGKLTLSRDAIVHAAINLANHEGLKAVSIRRIATVLGASPMALYYHIPSKDDLLNLMLDATYAQLTFPDGVDMDWRQVLSLFAAQHRRNLEQNPWSISIRLDSREYGPEGIRALEWYLGRLSSFGLDVPLCVRILGLLLNFVIGFVSSEPPAAARRTPRTRAANPLFAASVLATGRYPFVTKFVQVGIEPADNHAFARALNWLLDGVSPVFEGQHALAPQKGVSP
jgi:AcrR family transcriptional regulator